MAALSLAESEGGIVLTIIEEELPSSETPPTTLQEILAAKRNSPREIVPFKREDHFIPPDLLTDDERTRAREILSPKPHNLSCLNQPLAAHLQDSYVPISERAL
jgi:hypothetical protein